ncbi:putative disease resistance protein [Vitis vinifera]|uniref:Putative disease resistance protein n=1 Tax=Vitis vinifera TaxID=29760 RepID=A0A438KRG0_VITVI|nr:putative disease resistance protein [Vitis vinifera]
MALALVEGAALGAGIRSLLRAVIKASKKLAGFDCILKKLEAIYPSDGKRMGYANKIKAFDAYLLRLFQVDVQVQLTSRFWPCSNQIDSVGITANRGVSDEYDNLGSCNAPGPPEFMMGLDVPLKELKRRLCEDGKSRIVIRAPRGCGKTTLAKGLCLDNQVKEYFKHILYATVSKRPNLIAIIKKLLWDKDEQVPEFRNEEDAVNQMELKPKRKAESGAILLVLDDVWCGSESLLAKFKFQISESKVLVTSRNEFPEFGSTYNLELWNKEDTMVLFRHSATPSMETVISHTSADSEALQETSTGPGSVGRSLHGQPVEIWRSRLMKLYEGQSIVDSETDLRKCLQSSLDALNDEDVMQKECFMDFTRNDASEIDGCYSGAFVM